MRRVAIDPIATAETLSPARLCDHPGCEAGGEFRAPRSRIELDHYYWFCIDHIRAYNSAWNYYAGMSEAEIEAEIRHDTTWQRPTWKLGMRHGPAYEARMRDPFGLYGQPPSGKAHKKRRAEANGPDAVARAASAREQALAVFDIDPPFTQTNLKARYKVLVKLHHPDAHGGDKEAEEKLKIINQAYTTLKASYFA
jgi:DnaJ domain